jgi:hypothetical protein
VLEVALERQPVPLQAEPEPEAPPPPADGKPGTATAVKH